MSNCFSIEPIRFLTNSTPLPGNKSAPFNPNKLQYCRPFGYEIDKIVRRKKIGLPEVVSAHTPEIGPASTADQATRIVKERRARVGVASADPYPRYCTDMSLSDRERGGFLDEITVTALPAPVALALIPPPPIIPPPPTLSLSSAHI